MYVNGCVGKHTCKQFIGSRAMDIQETYVRRDGSEVTRYANDKLSSLIQ